VQQVWGELKGGGQQLKLEKREKQSKPGLFPKVAKIEDFG